MDQLSRIFHWEVFQYDKFSNVPNLQLDRSMSEKNIRSYVLHNWLYRPSWPLKFLLFKLKASCYIERLDRNRTIWSSNFYQLYITKIYFRQKIVRRSSWLNEALLEKNYSTRAHWDFNIRWLCKYWCNTEYTSLFKRLLTINKTRSERKPSCYHHN